MVTTTQWTGGNGNWTDPTWTNGVPDSTTDAIIEGTAASPVTVTFDTPSGAAFALEMEFATLAVDSGTLALGSASRLDALTQSGGLLDFAGGGTIDGPLSQTGGTLAIGAGETLNLETSSALAGSIDGAGTLATLGSTTVSGLTLGDGLQWIDRSISTMQTGVLTIGEGSGDAASVVNTGIWTFASGAEIAQSADSSFINTIGGDLRDTAAGTVSIAGDFINNGVVENHGPGTLLFSDGTFTNQSKLNDPALVVAESGAIVFAADEINKNFTGGTLAGTGEWEAETGGTIELAGGPITTIAGKANVILDASSEFAGGDGTTFTPIQQSLTMIAEGATLDLFDGTYAATNALTVDGLLRLTHATFSDSATLKVGTTGTLLSGGGDGHLGTVAAPVLNFGTIAAYGAAGGQMGILDLTGPLTNEGVLNANTLGVINVSGAENRIAGHVTGPGALFFIGGSSTIEPGAGGDIHTVFLEEGATLALARNVADLYDFLEVANGGTSVLDLGGHTAKLSDSVFSSPSGGKALVEGGGTLAAVGTMVLVGVALDQGTVLTNSRRLTQSGPVTLGDAAGGTASIENLASGTYTMAGAVSLAAASSTADTVTNAGLFEKTGSGTAAIGAAFTNDGTIEVTAGTLAITAPFTNTGTIIGTEIQSNGTTFITAPSAALFNQYAAATKTAGSESLVHSPPVQAATATLAQPAA